MKFKHKSNGEIVTIKNGDAENVWYTKEDDERVYLLQADVFFTEYESIRKRSSNDSNKISSK